MCVHLHTMITAWPTGVILEFANILNNPLPEEKGEGQGQEQGLKSRSKLSGEVSPHIKPREVWQGDIFIY